MVPNIGIYYSRANLESEVSTALSNMVSNSLPEHLSHPLHGLCEHPSLGVSTLLSSGEDGDTGRGTGHTREMKVCPHPPAPLQNPDPITSPEQIAAHGPSERLAGSTLLQHPHCHKWIHLICIQSCTLETRSQLFYFGSVASVAILTLKLHDD